MKTKFIEGTNKKYSIREDGFVIRNYIESKNQYGKCFSCQPRKVCLKQENSFFSICDLKIMYFQ